MKLTLDVQVHAELEVSEENAPAQQFVLAGNAQTFRQALTGLKALGFSFDVDAIETGLHFLEPLPAVAPVYTGYCAHNAHDLCSGVTQSGATCTCWHHAEETVEMRRRA